MGFFGKKSEPATPEPPAPVKTAPPAPSAPQPAAVASSRPAAPPQPAVAGGKTTIAAGSKVKGDVIGETELVIEGTVEGVVRVDNRVEVGARGEVHGQILAQSVRIGGKVYGNVAGKDRVEVLLSGALQGDVHSPKVSIAEGGFFKGNIDMSEVTAKIVPKPDAAKPEPAKSEPAKAEAPRNEPPKNGSLAGGAGGDKGRKDK